MPSSTTLVTGGAGYIGSHIVLALQEAGQTPIVLDDLSTGREALVPENVAFIEGNCGNEKIVAETIRKHNIKSVIHCAGSISVEESVKNPLLYYRNNTANSRTLIETCVRETVPHFLFSSTAAVYGNPKKVPVGEDSDLIPINPYGKSKLMTEVMLADTAAASPLRYVALRYFNVAGADPQGRCGQVTPFVTHLIRRALYTALGRYDKMEIFGTDWPTPDGTCVRDYIHVTDLASAHVLALKHLQKTGDNLTLNCGYGHGFSVRDVLKTVEAVIKKNLPIVESPRRAGDPASLISDANWLRKNLGWTPQLDNLETIVTHAYQWELKHADLNKKP